MAAQIQYPYAFDENNNLVFIDDVVKENRYDHTYHCPNCGGEMLTRLGEHNKHCFAHAGNQKCSGESYLHKAAKLLLARRFNERSKPFKIGLTSERPCDKLGTCPDGTDKCYLLPEYKEFDLMEFYDLPAEVEVDILGPGGETHFTPDAMLRSSNPKRSDIFIEVYYKHKVTKDKIASGHQIIEIRVRELADLKGLEETECFKESKDVLFYNFKPRTVTPEQITDAIHENAEENDHYVNESDLPPCKQSRKTKREQSHLRRLTLYKSGKLYDEGIFEEERDTHKSSALMDITYDAEIDAGRYALLGVMAKRDRRARLCDLCEHCIKYETATWCKQVKNGTSRKGTFDPLKGVNCQFFEWRMYPNLPLQIDNMLAEQSRYIIWVNPNAYPSSRAAGGDNLPCLELDM